MFRETPRKSRGRKTEGVPPSCFARGKERMKGAMDASGGYNESREVFLNLDNSILGKFWKLKSRHLKSC